MKSAVMIGLVVGAIICLVAFFSGCDFVKDNGYAYWKDIKAVRKEAAIQKAMFDAAIKTSREREDTLARWRDAHDEEIQAMVMMMPKEQQEAFKVLVNQIRANKAQRSK